MGHGFTFSDGCDSSNSNHYRRLRSVHKHAASAFRIWRSRNEIAHRVWRDEPKLPVRISDSFDPENALAGDHPALHPGSLDSSEWNRAPMDIDNQTAVVACTPHARE
jgi:hypothetical protein